VWSKPVGETGSPPAPLQKGGAGAPLSFGGSRESPPAPLFKGGSRGDQGGFRGYSRFT